MVAVTDKWREIAESFAANISGFTEQDALDSPHLLIGTLDQIVEKLQALRERFGISYIKVPAQNMTTFAPVVSQLANR